MAGNQSAFQKALNQGHSAAWDQDWQKAAEFYDLAVAEFPENPLALSSLGLAYYEQQDYERSLDCYQRAARVAPAAIASHNNMPAHPTSRCVICTSPCTRSWQRHCGRCRAWLRFGQGLRTMRGALRGNTRDGR